MSILEPSGGLPPLPEQPHDVEWPTERWPEGPFPTRVDQGHVDGLLDQAFGPDHDPGFGESHATLVVQGGRLVAERYGAGTSPTTPLASWSMAKSVLHAIVGILVRDGELDPGAPARVSEWDDQADPRHEITLTNLLRMTDGLHFNEQYAFPEPDADPNQDDWSHAIDMLFGAGAEDHGAYTAGRPLAHPPGTVFNYSSGTSNVIARMVCDVIGR
ncbi:MAG: serine hydrolase, partial [Actinomycetia bacterium]|nr:serine hydrolase [Actinomycetes bacterium]